MNDGYYSITSFCDHFPNQASDCLKKFDCTPIGSQASERYIEKCEELNSFLRNHAYEYGRNNILRTTVLVKSGVVIGFISICTGSSEVTSKYRKKHKIMYAGVSEYSSINITHFCVDQRFQHNTFHYGHVIFNDTLKRILNQIVPQVGVTLVMVVEALNEARRFYEEDFQFTVHDSRNTTGDVNLAITIPELSLLVGGTNNQS